MTACRSAGSIRSSPAGHGASADSPGRLIARSLVLLRDRGVASAALGVDASNPNQALGLYESCGFRRASSTTSYRKAVPSSPVITSPLEAAP